MEVTMDQPREDQTALWNGLAGQAWVDMQEHLDRLFEPIENRLVEAVRQASARRVLDLGCGTGATTLAIQRHLGDAGRCTGIDISEPMLATARVRAEREGSRAQFIHRNVEQDPVEPGGFEMIVSRFGAMFFDDPVHGFGNLKQAAADQAAMQLVVWRSAADNPFMTVAETAAAPLLPALPPRDSDGPGQFAFADPQRVRQILEDSGWKTVAIDPVDFDCSLPEPELVNYFTRLGPLGRVLQDVDGESRVRIVQTVRTAFDRYVDGRDVRFTAACWSISARA